LCCTGWYRYHAPHGIVLHVSIGLRVRIDPDDAEAGIRKGTRNVSSCALNLPNSVERHGNDGARQAGSEKRTAARKMES
jgi:hypothetical protein